ncbi:MAG TPA: hypothetical protein HPP66_02830 [Planctomycetes bacterium]|nr:hypothetical protein [Planctomycetota bacterium]
MKKITAILTGCIVLTIGLFLLFNNPSDEDTPNSESIPSETTSTARISVDKSGHPPDRTPSKPITPVDSSVTKEEFGQLSREDQDKMVEEFVDVFWKAESGVSEQTVPEREYLSLDVFSSPYMQTINESDFLQLSPEDRETAIVKVMDSCRQYRTHILDVIAQAKVCASNNDYVRAEAHLISGLERGRALSANKEGLLITRLVGIACQKASLKEMERLYTSMGAHSKVQMAQRQLQDIEIEVAEIRETAQQFKQ